jgi:hypothetical protein
VQSLILAHQGGWDEALMVLVPIGLFIAVLRVADRRAKQVQATRLQTGRAEPEQVPEQGGDDDDGDDESVP